jgi:hypothetical protein
MTNAQRERIIADFRKHEDKLLGHVQTVLGDSVGCRWILFPFYDSSGVIDTVAWDVGQGRFSHIEAPVAVGTTYEPLVKWPGSDAVACDETRTEIIELP